MQASLILDLLTMNLGVCMPTRGLIFAECQQALEENLEGFDYKIYRSFILPIPDSHNFLTEKALREGCTHIFFVEDDTVVPDGGLRKLIEANADIACIDYGVAGYSCTTKDRQTGEILWCGLGCTLVKASVFAKLEVPYFRSDKQLLLNNYPNEEWINAPRNCYGGQDIYFCMQARKAGFKIKQIEGECRHLQLNSLGKKETNQGIHSISEKPKISKHQTLPL